METWLGTNWWLVLTLLAIAFGAYFRMDGSEKRLDKHLDPANTAPHPNCPVHTMKFEEMCNSLGKIEKRLEKMDTRIYGFMRSNGFREEGDE